ncbi:MAG: hypothetical protein RL701_7324, partial [Pseudomonadota bacterium]
RPERPIPAGEISAASAAALGCALSAAGLGLAALHGKVPFLVSVLLLAVVLAYDALLKGGWAGPLAMGVCRALNVFLGLSVDLTGRAWLTPSWLVLGVFTLLITELSRFEVGGTQPARLRNTLFGFSALALVAAVSASLFAWRNGAPPVSWIVASCAFGFVLWRERQLLAPIWHKASGPLLGRAIGGGILLMPAIDATFVAAAGAPLAAAVTAAFMAPAWLLKRWYYLT